MSYRVNMTGNSNGPARELAPLLAAVVELAADFSPGQRGERGVRPQVQALCRAARTCGLAVEQMLILIKRAWWQYGSVLEAPHLDARGRLGHIITLCIDEYYRNDDGSTSGGGDSPASTRVSVSESRPAIS
jgi:hypothetical protein